MLKAGETIDIWQVERALGAGGMGSVYRCHNRRATRILAAIKVLDPSVSRLPGAERRFVREAEILYRLDHPNIVKVRNIRTDHDPPYLEMEFVKGPSLEARLRHSPLALHHAVGVMEQVFDAVSYMHSQQVCHRDIKPANMLVQENGTVKLVDFGLALEGDGSRITQGSQSFGTVNYAPPEWVRPEELNPELWDVYACGVVAWEMLTGRVAFPSHGAGSARQQAMQVILAKQDHPPLDPGERFPEGLRELIRDMTRPRADERLSDMREARRRLLAFDLPSGPLVGLTLAPVPEDVMAEVEPSVMPDVPTSDPTWMERGDDDSDGLETSVPQGSRQPGIDPLARRIGIVVGVILLGLLSWVALGTGSGPTPPRALMLVADPSTNVALRLEGVKFEARDDGRFVSSPLSMGEYEVEVLIGPDCSWSDCVDERCPAWCGQHSQTVRMMPGDGPQAVPLDLPQTPMHEVSLTAGERVTLQVKPEVAMPVERLAPGRYEVLGYAGSCGDEPWICANTPCEGCVASVEEWIIPWTGPAPSLEHPVVAPPVAPRPARPERPRRRSARITYGGFARWLQDNPEWKPTAVRGTGRGDAQYLADWQGDSPPSGKDNQAMTHLNWYAAAAFCAQRGGLASVDAEPHTWTGSPTLELRSADGRGAWRMDNGTTSEAISLAQSTSFQGARCAR